MIAEQAALERRLVERLTSGEESAFEELIENYYRDLVPLARLFVSSREAAEEVVQETWLAVLHGISRFEGRSSLKTWLSRIVMNRARTKAVRESRLVPFSVVPVKESEQLETDRRYNPERTLLEAEAMAAIQAAVKRLPSAQRLLLTLRDIDEWEPEEACNLLGISEANQRVLLHRARSKIRSTVEDYFEG